MYLRYWLTGVATALLVALAAAFLAPAASAHHREVNEPSWLTSTLRTLAGSANSSKPDLTLILPRRSADPSGVPAFFVDTKEKPGKILFRFDTVILNSGGALDVYTPDDGKTVNQVVWPGGHPPDGDLPSPTQAPRQLQNQTDLAPDGARLKFVRKIGHNHFHLQRVARYQLVLANGNIRDSAKVGFCLLDSWDGPGTTSYFRISGERNFCQHGNPDAVFTRMGISPGTGDYYNSQLADQWVDVTGVRPGKHTVRGTVNPSGVLIESDASNNVTTDTRTIPGAIARPTTAQVATNRSVVIDVSGKVIGANVPSRRNRSCELFQPTCYKKAARKKLDFKIRKKPGSGKVAILAKNGLTARIRYTPRRGFQGPDSFKFVTTDSRGLTSKPATVRVQVG